MIETLSLEELRSYQGRQEVPEDFDSFWNQELKKLEKEPAYQLKKVASGLDFVETFTLSFESSAGHEIFAKCLFPKVEKPVPLIFYFHGYQGQSPDWSACLNYLAAGYALVSMDLPGQAGQSVEAGNYKGMTVKGHVIRGMLEGRERLYYKSIYLAIYQLIEIVSSFDRVDEKALSTYGASQGGALALVAAALNPKIKKVASIYPFLSDFKRVLELGNHSQAYDELFRYFKFSDPLHRTENDILESLAYIDVKNFAHRITAPLIFITGMEDEVCPPVHSICYI